MMVKQHGWPSSRLAGICVVALDVAHSTVRVDVETGTLMGSVLGQDNIAVYPGIHLMTFYFSRSPKRPFVDSRPSCVVAQSLGVLPYRE